MILSDSSGLQQTFGDEEFFVTATGELAVPEGQGFWMLLAGLPIIGIVLRKRARQ